MTKIALHIGVCVALLAGIPLSAADSALPRLEVRADRETYRAGETAMVSLELSGGGPGDLYLVLTTPSGRRLYADQTLQFRRARVAVASGVVAQSGKVEIPISLATSDLARPGEYELQAFATNPGEGPDAADIVGKARFLVTIPGLNFLAIHDENSPSYDNQCGDCHVDKTREVTLAPGIPSFHSLKNRMFSRGGRSSCTVCHAGADLVDKSAATLRKQVPPEFCAQCHGALGTGERLFAR